MRVSPDDYFAVREAEQRARMPYLESMERADRSIACLERTAAARASSQERKARVVVTAEGLKKVCAGRSLHEVSQALGYGRNYLANRVVYASMSRSVAVKLASLLGCNVEDFGGARAE